MDIEEDCLDLISIIIPVFRVEQYLERCIKSIINQTYKKIQIILVDDGSDDRSPQICDNYAKIDKRIKVIHKKNGGLSDARNYGLKEANGRYITFVDSDDYIEHDYIEFLYKLIINNNADISICAYKAIYDTGAVLTQESNKKFILTPKETIEKMLYQEDFNVAVVAKMYKKSLFSDVKFPIGEIFEDARTTYKLVLKSKKIVCDMKSKYNYMIRSNSILTANFYEKKLTLIDAYEIMGNDVLKIYPELKDAVVRGKVYSRISTLRQIINCKPRLKEKEKLIRKAILSNKEEILFNNRVCLRDKMAIIILMFGTNLFKYSWNLYRKITGRNL